jgi:membrane protein
LLLVSLVVSTALSAVAKYFSGMWPGLAVFWTVVNIVVSLLVISLLFAMIFKVLPDVKIGWRDVGIGAAITALLFTGGKFLLGWYLGRNSTVSAYGAAGSLVLILLWVYYSAQILFFGAEFTRAYADRYGVRLVPKSHAQWVACADHEKVPEAAVKRPGPPGRKERLVSELRAEVESLRALVQH